MKQAEYDAIQAKIAELTAMLENAEIEPEPRPTGWAEREDNRFIFLNPLGKTDEGDLEGPRMMFDIANKFTNDDAGYAKAEEVNAAQRCYRLLKRFSDENGVAGINWGDSEQCKYYVCFNHDVGKLVVDFTCINQAPGQVYFISRGICEQAIEKYRPQIMAAMGIKEDA
jgi:hypothetical protein